MSELLHEALSAYGLDGAATVFIQHNENLTYRVADQYLLRIHQPREGISTAAFDDGLSPIELRCTEMAFLRHLTAKGLTVQRPVPNLRGEDVTLLKGGVCATLLTWLEGKALMPEICTPDICRELGALTFRLHQAAQDFHPATAREYNAAHCQRTANVIAELPLSDGDRSLMLKVLAHIGEIFASRTDAALMIHADLNPSNVLKTPTGIATIDFSLCGIGHPMFDLAVLSATVPMEHLDCCKEGYLAAGGTIDGAAYDAGFALGMMGMITIFGEGMVTGNWFPNVMAQWTDRIFKPLLSNLPIRLSQQKE